MEYLGHTLKLGWFDSCYIDDKCIWYDDILKIFRPDVMWITESEQDYQGEWFAIGFDGTKYYWQQGSFGSCSGCDWLQSITDEEGLLELVKDVLKVMTFDTLYDLISYLVKEKSNMWSAANEVIDDFITWLGECIT